MGYGNIHRRPCKEMCPTPGLLNLYIPKCKTFGNKVEKCLWG